MKISYQVFMDFLRDRNVENEFQRNYSDQNGGVKLTEEAWDDMDIPLEIVLGTLIDWDATPEGRRIWQRVDNYFQRKFVEGTACTLAPKIECEEDEAPVFRSYFSESEEAPEEKAPESSKGDAAWDSFFFS